MFVLKLIVLILIAQMNECVIYKLNESEFERMPPLYHLDPFEPCVEQGGRYCSADMDLVSDTPSELLTMIQEYSAHIPMHYNHSKLSYGICVSETCKHLELQTNTTTDLKETLEACLNDSFWRDYNLKVKISDKVTCNKIDGNYINIYEITVADVLVAVMLVMLLMCHVIGNIRELTKKEKQQDTFISSFSLRENWRRLMAHPQREPRFQGMVAYNGIRAMTTAVMVLHHSIYILIICTDSTLKMEETAARYKYLSSATYFVQTFFAMSGHLLAYNVKVYNEKHRLKWYLMAMKILQRWLRLMAPLAVVLAVKGTWLRFMGYRPFWQTSMGKEIEDCRRDWWLIPIMGINYVDNSTCMTEMWYVAADMHLSIITLVVFALTKGRTRKFILALFLMIGIFMPGLQTYLQDLDGVGLSTPEGARHSFLYHRTFNNMHKRTHTNITGYMLGVWSGLLTYYWQKINFNSEKKLGYRILIWTLIILNFGMMLVGSLFYADAPPPPLYVRVLTSVLLKAVFEISICIGLVFWALNFDKLMNRILSWQGWVAPARVTYCVYISHMFVIKMAVALRTTPIHMSDINVFLMIMAVIGASYVVGAVLWLCVEAPASRVLGIFFTPKELPSKESKDTEEPAEDTCKTGNVNE